MMKQDRLLTLLIDEKCKEAIIAAVKRIADRDLALWERWVQRKEHNTNWQQLLFSVLSKVSREALKRFAQTINLDMMLQNHKEDIVAYRITYIIRQIEKRCKIARLPDGKYLFHQARIISILADTVRNSRS